MIGLASFLVWKYRPGLLSQLSSNSGAHSELISKAKSNYSYIRDVPMDIVEAIIMVESNGDPSATGAADEYGLMQILPTTWAWITNKYELPSTNPYYDYWNIIAGMHYLKDVYLCIGGSWSDAIHGYNVGCGGFKNGIRNWDYANKVALNRK